MAFNYLPYQQKASALESGLNSKLTANAYARFLNKQRGNRQMFDTRQQFEKQTPGVIGSFTKRGLAGPGVRSGIFQRGMDEFGTQQFNALQNVQDTMNQGESELNQQEADLRAQYKQDIADLEMQKNAQIAQSAATLSAFKPYLN
jgi:glycosylphosphatidylinositol transamidase (GPIT) subunit GPI8